jgi:hypothetical protein
MVREPTTGQAIQALFMHPKPNQDLLQIPFEKEIDFFSVSTENSKNKTAFIILYFLCLSKRCKIG